jgi:hypothetical protein
MSTQKVIPGLEDVTAEAPPDVEVAPPLAQRSTFSGTLAPKPVQPSRSQMLARMPTSRAEMLAKQNRAIAKIKAPSKHITTSEWVAYRIDQYISTRKGQTATLSLLGLLLMTLGGIFLKAVRPSTAFRETVWEAWTFLADSGSHTTLVEEVRTWFVCMQVLERVRLIKRCGLVLSAGPTRGGRAHESRRHLVLLRHHGVRRGRNSSEDGHAEEREIQRRGDEAHSKWRCVRSEKSLACFD